MGHTSTSGHHRRLAQSPVPKKVQNCLRCQKRHSPAPCTTASLRRWNEDLRMQERRFIRDQEHERIMFMRKIDFHRRKAIHQVHSANLTGSRHWPRTVDRSHYDQKSDHEEKEGQRKLLGQQDLRQTHRRQQRRGGAKAPARHHFPAVHKQNPAPRKEISKATAGLSLIHI